MNCKLFPPLEYSQSETETKQTVDNLVKEDKNKAFKKSWSGVTYLTLKFSQTLNFFFLIFKEGFCNGFSWNNSGGLQKCTWAFPYKNDPPGFVAA